MTVKEKLKSIKNHEAINLAKEVWYVELMSLIGLTTDVKRLKDVFLSCSVQGVIFLAIKTISMNV